MWKWIIIVFFSLIALSQSQGVERNIDIDDDYLDESHFVTTPDGYILKVFRIYGSVNCPPEDGKPVVFLQHGFLSSAADWVVQGPGKSLPYLLADAGYDVWLGNSRGNTYSRAHTSLDPKEPEFWRFGFEDIATSDLPTTIDFILAETGADSLHYIGHSQGAKAFFAMQAMNAGGLKNKTLSMHALAPTAFMGHAVSPFFRLPAAFEKLIYYIGPHVGGAYEFLPNYGVFVRAAQQLCYENSPFTEVCKSIFFLMFGGFDSQQLEDSLVPKILKEATAGGSLTNYVHSLQLVKSKKFQRFDYGRIGNKISYGSPTPPEYDLSAVETPVYVHYGANDWVAVPEDVQLLQQKLGNLKEIREVDNGNWNHIDFLFGKDAHSLLYNYIIEKLGEY